MSRSIFFKIPSLCPAFFMSITLSAQVSLGRCAYTYVLRTVQLPNFSAWAIPRRLAITVLRTGKSS